MNARKCEIHKQICEYLNEIYRLKNSDYGDSFAKIRKEYPDAVLIRLMDKLERLKTLYGKQEGAMVIDESVHDTLLDLANYCLLELVEFRVDEDEKCKAKATDKAAVGVIQDMTLNRG